MKLIVLPILLLFFQHSYAQMKMEDQNAKLSLIVRGGLMYTDLYNPTFFYLICFEGCGADEQNGVTGKTINLGLAYQINERNQLTVLTGYSEFGYYEKGFSSIGSGSFSYNHEKMWEFWGVEIEHGLKILSMGKTSLFLGNGIRFETPLNDDTEKYNMQVLKDIGMSYNGRLGVEYQLMQRLSIVGNGLFKTSIFKYNKAEAVLDYNDYKPYGVGGEIGIKVKL